MTVAKEQAANQADLTALQNGNNNGGGGDNDGGRGGSTGGGEHGGLVSGNVLTSILNQIGVITTSPATSTTTPPTSSNPLVTQLQMDEQTLQTELQTLALKSAVTVSDVTRLITDSQGLAALSGVGSSALVKALSDLAAANAADVPITTTPTAAQTAGRPNSRRLPNRRPVVGGGERVLRPGDDHPAFHGHDDRPHDLCQ